MGWTRFARDFILIQAGFALFGLAINIYVNSSLGLDSWDVLQMALTYHLPITLGESSIGVAALVVVADLMLKEPLGWGTIANMIFVGVWIDILKPYVPTVPVQFALELIYLLVGTVIMGFATAIYIAVDAGAGPRDSLMLAVARIGKVSVRVARAAIEISVVVIGWFLGGPVWLGTLVAALAIGPIVQFAFKIFKVKTNQKEFALETPQ